MEIRDVIGNLREENLRLSRRVESIASNLSLLERFTWNLLKEVREAMNEGCQIIWDLGDELAAADAASTMDSPERTDDEQTLF